MKKCTHCGKEYPDDKLICEDDAWPLVDPAAPEKPTTNSKSLSSGRFVFFLCIVAVQLSVFFAGGEWHQHGRNAVGYAVAPFVGDEASEQVQAFIGFLVSPISVAIVVIAFIVIELGRGRRKM